MKEAELLGRLIPGHPDIFPIIKNIRKNYKIPEVNPEDEDIAALLLTNYEIDWEAVRQDIETQVQEIQFLDDPAARQIQLIKKLQTISLDFPELESCPPEVKEQVKKLFSIMINNLTPVLALYDAKVYKPLTELVFEYLLTGRTREVPQDWFGKVTTMDILGGKVVLALAGEGSDPKVLAEQFKSEFKKTFPNRERKITDTHLKAAEYLRMQLQGDSMKRLVERYEELHPSEFPSDRNSPEHKKAVQNHIDMIEKRRDSLYKVIDKIVGDES